MSTTVSPPARPVATFVVGGSSFLFYRALVILTDRVLRPWVRGLAAVELTLDGMAVAAAVRWWVTQQRRHGRGAMGMVAAVVVVHAVRVAVFVAGRFGPWKDFDVEPEHRADHDRRWSWFAVLFATVMSAVSVAAIGAIWWRRRPTGR